MSKHTPGPWKAVYIGCSDWDLNGPVTEQDWKLAAAAPDLLNAVRFLLSNPDNRISKADRDAAYAAIAKATGENQ